MIALDTNILVYAYREESNFFTLARQALQELAESNQHWAIPWPVIHEFVAIVTHPKIFRPPSPLEEVLRQIDNLSNSPTLRFLGENESYWNELKQISLDGQMTGPKFHDARIAAICLSHGVTTLWSADRDFGRIPHLPVVNPLVHGRKG